MITIKLLGVYYSTERIPRQKGLENVCPIAAVVIGKGKSHYESIVNCIREKGNVLIEREV